MEMTRPARPDRTPQRRSRPRRPSTTTAPCAMFPLAAVVWGIVGMLRRRVHRRRAGLAGAQSRHSVADLRPAAPAAHQRRDLRVRRLGADGHLPITSCSAPARCALFSPKLRRLHLLGLAGGDRRRRRSRCRSASRSGKEYAELEWPIDILIAVVWVVYAVVFFGTLGSRSPPHLRRELVLRRVHHRRRAAAHRQQRRDSGRAGGSPTRSIPACSTRWCSGGTATTRSAFS